MFFCGCSVQASHRKQNTHAEHWSYRPLWGNTLLTFKYKNSILAWSCSYGRSHKSSLKVDYQLGKSLTSGVTGGLQPALSCFCDLPKLTQNHLWTYCSWDHNSLQIAEKSGSNWAAFGIYSSFMAPVKCSEGHMCLALLWPTSDWVSLHMAGVLFTLWSAGGHPSG